ncbi:MAG: hydrogenase maturation protease [Candidatus Marinimicrobia bacterium]|nr:hydrogenase maturation protease [Candidatus Neomarinimicrobiota bacterium]MBL7022495.1 hydrogenase maturation protease [Candidatus Neomarinimicrobiota bacterium]MBL7108650.1 hydrogenase maturation protease [Candidatus Neomarinimicrobiota bacterium]
MNKSTSFFSVGNPLYGDDGVGKAVLDTLKALPEYKNATFFDAGTDALSLIDHFSKDGQNIIVDAAKMGKSPGSVVAISPKDAKLIIQWDHLSIHGFGLAETFQMAEKIGSLPKKVIIIGIEPEEIKIDKGLSETVVNAIPKAINLIKREVNINGS